jgi:hypothetical protein
VPVASPPVVARPTTGPSTPTTRRWWRAPALLALLALVAIAPIVAPANAQPASRYALTAALAEHGSVDVGPYRDNLDVDVAIYDGELRSDKPPGQPILAVPFYAAARAVGMASFADQHLTAERPNLGLWWVTFWSAMVPFAALVALLYVVARRVAPEGALPAVLTTAGSTMLLLYGSQLYGHALAALLAYAAWAIADTASPRARWPLAAAGLLGATAVTVEYHAAIAVVVVLIAIAVRDRRGVGPFLAGCAPPALVLAIYHHAAFGAAWRLPYAFYATKVPGAPTDGGYDLPSIARFSELLLSPKGLLLASPLVVVAFGAAVLLARAREHARGPASRHAVVGLAVMGAYLVLCAGWSGSRLIEDPGPRYLVPAIPFLVVPLAAAWSRVRAFALPATIAGAIVMAGATLTPHLTGVNALPLRAYVHNVQAREINDTLWSLGFGRPGTAAHLVSVVAVVALLVGAKRAERVFD